MLIRALTYREQGLALTVEKALSGGTEGVVHMTVDSCGKDHGRPWWPALTSRSSTSSGCTRAPRPAHAGGERLPMRGLADAQRPPRQRQEHHGVMMLAAGKGASITVQAEGEDAEAGARRGAETDRGQVRRGRVG